MDKFVQINYEEIEENTEYYELIKLVVDECFKTEEITDKNLYINIILTTPSNIREINCKYRNIDKETDVLSFPMFEKGELQTIELTHKEALGDVVISIDRVKEQAKEYGHEFKRELAYMVVHGFYHLMGYDHIEDDDKLQMRQKEENILDKLNITR